MGDTAAHAVVGGLASVAGGDKFENGAVTAVFGYLFNHAGHMLVGTDAHHQLLEDLRERDPGKWSGNITLDGLFGSGRPDLIYQDSPYKIFEIKPDGSEAAAVAQLRRYLSTPGANAEAGDFKSLIGYVPPLSGGWFGETTYTYQAGTAAGVVLYSVENRNVFEQALRQLGQRSVGGPSPLGRRLPPTPVP